LGFAEQLLLPVRRIGYPLVRAKQRRENETRRNVCLYFQGAKWERSCWQTMPEEATFLPTTVGLNAMPVLDQKRMVKSASLIKHNQATEEIQGVAPLTVKGVRVLIAQ